MKQMWVRQREDCRTPRRYRAEASPFRFKVPMCDFEIKDAQLLSVLVLELLETSTGAPALSCFNTSAVMSLSPLE